MLHMSINRLTWPRLATGKFTYELMRILETSPSIGHRRRHNQKSTLCLFERHHAWLAVKNYR